MRIEPTSSDGEPLLNVVDKLLCTLTPREEEYIRDYFGIGRLKVGTLREIGDRHGLSQSRIQQIIARGIRKLRHPIRSKHLKKFILDGQTI